MSDLKVKMHQNRSPDPIARFISS